MGQELATGAHSGYSLAAEARGSSIGKELQSQHHQFPSCVTTTGS